MKQSSLYKKLLSFIFPEKCLLCRATGEVLCPNCIKKFKISEKTELSYAFSLFSYQDPNVRKVIKNFKNNQNQYLAEKMSKLMYENFLSDISDLMLFGGEKIIIIPIPSSSSHMKKRFKDHSLLLSNEFAKNDISVFEVCDCLVKTRKSQPQSEIKNRKNRIKNANNLYKVSEKYTKHLYGKTVLIIDDITTTGATIENSKKALIKIGANKIMAITFAH